MKKLILISSLAVTMLIPLIAAQTASAASDTSFMTFTCNSRAVVSGMDCSDGFDAFGPKNSCETALKGPCAAGQIFSCEAGKCYKPAVVGAAAACPTLQINDAGSFYSVLSVALDTNGLARLVTCGDKLIKNYFGTLAFGSDGSISNTATGANGAVKIVDADGFSVGTSTQQADLGFAVSNGKGGNIFRGVISNPGGVKGEASSSSDSIPELMKDGMPCPYNSPSPYGTYLSGPLVPGPFGIGEVASTYCVKGNPVVISDPNGTNIYTYDILNPTATPTAEFNFIKKGLEIVRGSLEVASDKNGPQFKVDAITGAISNPAIAAPKKLVGEVREVKIYDTDGLVIANDGGTQQLKINGSNGTISNPGTSSNGSVHINDPEGLTVYQPGTEGYAIDATGYSGLSARGGKNGYGIFGIGGLAGGEFTYGGSSNDKDDIPYAILGLKDYSASFGKSEWASPSTRNLIIGLNIDKNGVISNPGTSNGGAVTVNDTNGFVVADAGGTQQLKIDGSGLWLGNGVSSPGLVINTAGQLASTSTIYAEKFISTDGMINAGNVRLNPPSLAHPNGDGGIMADGFVVDGEGAISNPGKGNGGVVAINDPDGLYVMNSLNIDQIIWRIGEKGYIPAHTKTYCEAAPLNGVVKIIGAYSYCYIPAYFGLAGNATISGDIESFGHINAKSIGSYSIRTGSQTTLPKNSQRAQSIPCPAGSEAIDEGIVYGVPEYVYHYNMGNMFYFTNYSPTTDTTFQLWVKCFNPNG
jgi:hypothetical protein